MAQALIGAYLFNRLLKAIGVKRDTALMIVWICLLFVLSWELLLMFQTEPYERVFIFDLFHVGTAIWLVGIAITRGRETSKQLARKEIVTQLAREQVLYWKDELQLEKNEALSIYYNNRFRLNDEYRHAGRNIVLILIQEEYGRGEYCD